LPRQNLLCEPEFGPLYRLFLPLPGSAQTVLDISKQPGQAPVGDRQQLVHIGRGGRVRQILRQVVYEIPRAVLHAYENHPAERWGGGQRKPPVTDSHALARNVYALSLLEDIRESPGQGSKRPAPGQGLLHLLLPDWLYHLIASAILLTYASLAAS